MADGGAALLVDGTETVWRCRRCAAPFVPRDQRHTHCSDACRVRWRDEHLSPERLAAKRSRADRWHDRNASYHRARAALRKRGLLTPEVEARVRSALHERGEVPAAEIAALYAECGVGPRSRRPARPSAAVDPAPWVEPSPSLDRPLCVARELRVPARRGLDHFEARLLHGALSTRLRLEHEPGRPAFSLVLPTRERAGWLIGYEPRATELTTHHAMLGGSLCLVELGARHRVRPPPVRAPGSYRARIVALSPIVFSHRIGDANYGLPQREPVALVSQLRALATRLRIDVGAIEARVLSRDLVACDVRVGGHVQVGTEHGMVGASWGSLVVECNATGRWLLDCAALVGLGGKTAFGFGRVRVEDA